MLARISRNAHQAKNKEARIHSKVFTLHDYKLAPDGEL